MYCSHVYHYKTVHIMMEENSLPANSGYTFFILCNRNRIIYPLARTHPEKKHHHSMHVKKKILQQHCLRSFDSCWPFPSPPHFQLLKSPFIFSSRLPLPSPLHACRCFPVRSLSAVYPSKIKPLLRRSHCCYRAIHMFIKCRKLGTAKEAKLVLNDMGSDTLHSQLQLTH